MGVALVLLSDVAFRGARLRGARLRGLLALLAGDLRTGCGTARLVAGLWPDGQPEHPAKALQVLVWRARAELGADLIARTPTGYRLALAADEVDAAVLVRQAAACARSARSGDHQAALAHADAGLAMWDGPAAGDGEGGGDPLSALRAEAAATRRSLVRARALALSRLGRHAEAAEPLAGLVAAHPRDEELLLELLRSEAATAGPPAALTRYERYRRTLRDELGTDPGPALRDLHRRLLRGDTPPARPPVPHDPNPLLGRAGDAAAVTGLLRAARVVSVVGPGGLGKTRLAYAVARQPGLPPVHVVALAGLPADGDVAGAVATALGVGGHQRGAAGPPAPADAPAGIAAALGPEPALLVLDNCEHVVRGAAELVAALVAQLPELRVLTTGRTPLGLSSESVYPLPELDLDTTVELFAQRARAARPGVDLPPEAVTALCRRLDGLPLAAELAAARVRVMSVAEIARRLDDRFGLLRGASRDAPPRHRTLHAVVDWSWHLLDPVGRAAMRGLSIFPAGFTAASARFVVGDDAEAVLEHLVDQSLLKVADEPAGTRFRMLETVREFSAARREAAGETGRAVAGLLAWARDFGVAHHDALLGPEPYPALALFRAEQDNLAEALRHGLARADGAAVAATTAVLAGLWSVESRYARMAPLAADTAFLLSHFRPGADLVEPTRTALVLCTAYSFALEGTHASRFVAGLRRMPPAPPTTATRAAAAVLGAVRGDGSAVYELCDSDQPLVAGAANCIASYLWEARNDVERARVAAERMLAAFGDRDAPWLRSLAHCRVAELRLQVGEGALARDHLAAAIPVLDALGAGADAAGVRWWLMLAHLQAGEVAEAERWLPPPGCDGTTDTLGYDLAARAELLLARGNVDAGLELWRRVVDRQATTYDPVTSGVPAELNPWTAEAQAVTVVAHARHGRADRVGDVVDEVERRLVRMLAAPLDRPPPYLMELAVCGTQLLALAMVDLDRAGRTGDAAAAGSGARLVALAERFRFLRYFHPTMSATAARAAARRADRLAYEDAVSSYASLPDDRLRAVALAALDRRAWSRPVRAAGPPPGQGAGSRSAQGAGSRL